MSALDGKTLRGSRDGDVPGTHPLAAYVPQVSAVIAHMRVEATTNEDKAALRLLGVLPSLRGVVVTAEAMFTHRNVSKKGLKQEGDYVLYAKDNQATLQRYIHDAFDAAGKGSHSPPCSRGCGLRMCKQPGRVTRGTSDTRGEHSRQ